MTIETILEPLTGQFMEPEIVHGDWVNIDGVLGGMCIPADIFDPENPAEHYGSTIWSVEQLTGYGARLSAPGYLDCTDWVGPFDTAEAAAQYLVETWAE